MKNIQNKSRENGGNLIEINKLIIDNYSFLSSGSHCSNRVQSGQFLQIFCNN